MKGATGAGQNRLAFFLSIAGGLLWNRKADSTHPFYMEQDFVFQNEKKVRKGAAYEDITVKILNARFRTGEHGEDLNIICSNGADTFAISIKASNGMATQFMRAMKIVDPSQDVYIKPYNFKDKDSDRQVIGLTFRQNGQKLNLWSATDNDNRFADKPANWDTLGKADRKYYYAKQEEILRDVFEKEVVPKFKGNEAPTGAAQPEQAAPTQAAEQPAPTQQATTTQAAAPQQEAPKEEVKKYPTPIQMKAALTAYIKENGYTESLPQLTIDELKHWYDLSQNFEELPFKGSEVEPDAVSTGNFEDDLNSALNGDGIDEDLPF